MKCNVPNPTFSKMNSESFGRLGTVISMTSNASEFTRIHLPSWSFLVNVKFPLISITLLLVPEPLPEIYFHLEPSYI